MNNSKRLMFRSFRESDAQEVFKLANDPDVGSNAGWNAHQSVEESKEIIKTVLSDRYTFAIRLEDSGELIGSISLIEKDKSNIEINENEVEIGYWIGKPYWNQGYASEAVETLVDYAFNQLGVKRVWCDNFIENKASQRVQEKCGFKFSHIKENCYFKIIDQTKTLRITYRDK